MRDPLGDSVPAPALASKSGHARARAAVAQPVIAWCMLLSLPAAIGAIGAHAAWWRARRVLDQPAIDALAPRLPSASLALSGGARWLRSPGLEEPGAAFADGPALPDPDPAGGAMAPPREAWAAEPRRAP